MPLVEKLRNQPESRWLFSGAYLLGLLVFAGACFAGADSPDFDSFTMVSEDGDYRLVIIGSEPLTLKKEQEVPGDSLRQTYDESGVYRADGTLLWPIAGGHPNAYLTKRGLRLEGHWYAPEYDLESGKLTATYRTRVMLAVGLLICVLAGGIFMFSAFRNKAKAENKI